MIGLPRSGTTLWTTSDERGFRYPNDIIELDISFIPEATYHEELLLRYVLGKGTCTRHQKLPPKLIRGWIAPDVKDDPEETKRIVDQMNHHNRDDETSHGCC